MTIFALSSGPGISGVAVIRLSGKETSKVIKLLTNKEIPKPRVATLTKINKINFLFYSIVCAVWVGVFHC